MDDGIANGTYERRNPASRSPLPCSPRRGWTTRCTGMRHYTGTSARAWFQNFILFTNYQFYIDEFVRTGPRGHGRPR